MKHGFPHAWYWKADDGRVYSAEKQSVVTESDPGYVAFIEKRGGCTRWPCDLDYKQTDESLLEAISKYGLHLTQKDALVTEARNKHKDALAGGVSVKLGKATMKVATDPTSLAHLNMLYQHAKNNSSENFSWIDGDGNPQTLTAEQVAAVHDAVIDFTQTATKSFADAVTAIKNKRSK